MVGGRQVLLSLAVLYGAGPNSALGGLLRLQDGYQSIGGPSFANTTSRTSSSVSLQAPTTTAATTSTIALVASTPVEPGTTLTSSIRRPPALPPNVGIPSVVSVEWKSSSAVVDMGVIKATVDTNSANPTSTADEYVYPPAMYGSDGALTTESDAFTRSVVATRNSIVPNQGTGRAPPPVDAPVTSSSAMVIIVPPRPPPLPKPVEPDSEDTPNDNLEESTLAPGGSTSNAQTPAAAAPTPPRFPPAPPTKNLASSTAQFTFSLVVTNIPSPTSTFGGYFNVSVPYTNQTAATPAPTPSSSLSFCQASDYTITRTVWSIVHTETITWYGKPEDYTPAYPTIATPTPTCIDIMSPPRFTVSVCTSTGTDSKYATCWLSTSTQTFVYGGNSLVPPNPITFTTTDKNPAVVYTTIETPDYGVSQEASTRRDYVSPTNHPTPIQTPQYQSSQRPGQKPGPQYMSSEPATPPPSPAPKPITVIVQPTAVIIGTSTIKDNTSSRTQTVVISDETFTVDPTRVVGGGATIDRPSVTGGGVVYPPRPTTTTLANVPVVISSSVAVIGGSSFTLGPTPTTAVVSGRTFTISPSGVAVDSQTFSLPSYPVPTEVVVADGQLITAIGKSVIVIKSTTITYGPGVSTTQIGDDLITFGPGGVTIPGGSVLGGPTAKSGETQFAVAGGVTITKIGFSTVVVGGQTYTVSPEMGTTSTVVEVGGERVTIASGGVTVGTTFSMAVPFGPVTVITPGATRAAGSSGVRETGKASSGAASSSGSVGGEGEPDEDAAGMVRPGLGILGTMVLAVLVCIL